MGKIIWKTIFDTDTFKKEYQWTKATYNGKTIEVGLCFKSPTLFELAFCDVESEKENQSIGTHSTRKDKSLITQIEGIIMKAIDKQSMKKIPSREEIEKALKIEKEKLALEEELVENTKKVIDLHKEALLIEEERVFRTKGLILITEYSLHIDKNGGKCESPCKECLNFIPSIESFNKEMEAHIRKRKGGGNETKR